MPRLRRYPLTFEMSTNGPITNKRDSLDVPPEAVDKAGLVQKAFDWLFGYDYFLAHRSADGKPYASALHYALTAKGNELDCFLDVKHYGAGGRLTNMQARALRKTTRLIVVVTPQAHDADAHYLQGEVAEFRRIHPQGVIVPIGTEECLTEKQCPKSPLLPLLPHMPNDICILESTEQFDEGSPSSQAVAKLLNDFSEERRSTKRLRWIRRVAALLLVLFFAASGFGIYAAIQRSKAKDAMNSAEQALTDMFIRTIGTSEQVEPTTDEREALWELAALSPANQNVRKKLLNGWAQSPDLLLRALAFDCRGLHTATGLNAPLNSVVDGLGSKMANVLAGGLENASWKYEGSELAQFAIVFRTVPPLLKPEEVATLAPRLTQALEKTRETDSRSRSSLGLAIAALAGKMNSIDAATTAAHAASLITKSLENPGTDSYLPSNLGKAMSSLAALMNPTDAADAAERLSKQLNNSETECSRLPDLGNSLAALAARMNPTTAATVASNGAVVLVKALESLQTQSSELPKLGDALTALEPHLNRESRAVATRRGGVMLAKSLISPRTGASRLPFFRDSLAALSSYLSSTDAAAIAEPLLHALENPQTELYRVSTLENALVALAVPMNPASAAAVAEPLVRAMANPQTELSRMSSFQSVLAALAARMNPTDAASVVDRVANALRAMQEDSSRLSPLAAALADLIWRGRPTNAAIVAAQGATVLMNRVEISQLWTPNELSNLGGSLAGLAAQMNPAESAAVAAKAASLLATGASFLSRQLNSPQGLDFFEQSKLGAELAALVARMHTTNAAPLAARGALSLAEALKKALREDNNTLSRLGAALTALAVEIPEAEETRMTALSFLLLRQVSSPPKAGDAEADDWTTIRRACSLLTTEHLVEILKWPFCVGEIQKLVLAELERRSEPPLKFDGDIAKFVKQAHKLKISQEFLNEPAGRLQITNAIAELKAIQTNLPQKR